MSTAKKYRLHCLSAFLIASLQACTVHFDALNADVPVIMNSKNLPRHTVVTHFSLRQESSFLFADRLFGGGKPDLTRMVQQQLTLTPGDAMVNVRIHGDTNVGDFLLPIIFGAAGGFVFPPLVLFVYEPLFYDLKTYTIEGDIIRYSVEPKSQSGKILYFDPMTGLPIEEKKKTEYDPETGLPKK